MQGAGRVVLVGRPNSGKSSLYNRVTGGSAQVANYPGVTVELLSAPVPLTGGRTADVVDLPGFYSLDAALDPRTDEGVARTYLAALPVGGSVVVHVLDGNRLALGLRLTVELLSQPWPLLVVVTQKDVTDAAGLSLDVPALSAALGVPVLHVSAHDPGARKAVLDAAEALLGSSPSSRGTTPDLDALAARVMKDAPRVDDAARRHRAQTELLDRVLLHPVAGPAVFLSLMTALFAAIFLVAEPASAVVDALVGWTRVALGRALGEGLLSSFLVDGVVAGAGTVLGFVPQVALLSVGMEALQASGYLARGAFLLDRLLHLLGLSGRSFVPLLMGHACAVPAITATRVIRDPLERLTAILVIPLMTCSARIPTYGLLVAAFFSAWGTVAQGALFVALYFAGVLAGLVASLVLRRTATSGRGLPLVMEMPDYRAPRAGVLLRKAYTAARDFVTAVGTTIVVASAVLWVLLNVQVGDVGPAQGGAEAVEHSAAAHVGKALEPITAPAGFDWRINVGLLASFGARELMVSTLGVIFGLEGAEEDPEPLAASLRDARSADGTPRYGTSTALSLMAFFVVACQCMSTVAAVRRETRSWRWPAFLVAYTYAAAWVLSVVVFQGARALGLS
jgi:ferrous iron transport protein B